MQTVVSNGKLMPGIYRAVVMEALTVQYNGEDVKCARIYIPALHKDQMPFTVDGDGTITGLNVSASRNSSSGLTVTSYSSLSTSTNTTTSSTSNTATNNSNNSSSSNNSTTTSSNSVPNNDSLVMTLNDYPVAQISCWKFCPEVKLGEPVWVVFENADSEYPIILGDLGAILPLLSQAAISGGSSSGGSSGSSGGSYAVGIGSTIIQKAVSWAVQTCQNDNIGYSTSSARWGPDYYDCSSFVITAYNQAGVPLRSAGAYNTDSMIGPMLQLGFEEITSQVNFSTGQGLQAGDVLWKSSHTEMMVSDTERAGAHTDDYAKPDQVSIEPYSNNSWTRAFRYIDTSSNFTTTNGNTTTIP